MLGSVTLGNSAGAVVVSVLVLLSHTSDRTPPGSRRTDGVAGRETVRPVPVPEKEAESPRSGERATPVEPPKPSVSAPSAKPPVSRKSGTPPGGIATGGLAQKESEPPQESQPPKASAPPTETVPRPETAPPTEAALPSPAPPATAATLDLSSLETRLRETKAIGVFTKLSLKNQVDDLLEEFREFHKSPDRSMLTRLRQAYDLLLLKVLSLLQDGDPVLARDISSSREALWSILTDPDKFKDL